MSSVSLLSAGLLAIVFLGGVAGLGLAYVTWQRRETTGGKPFVLYVLCYSGWMLSTGFVWTSSSQAAAVFFRSFVELFAVATLTAWALFVVAYTGTRDRFAGWRKRLLLGWAAINLVRISLNPVFGPIYASVDTVEYQGLTLVATEPSLFWLVTISVVFAILFWTFFLLGRFYRSEIAGQRRQAGLIFLAAIAPGIATTGYQVASISINEHLDPTPLFFTITVIGTWIALFQYDFLEIEPVAARTLFETMVDPVLVVDADDTVLNANESATVLPLAVGSSVPEPLASAIRSDETEARLQTVDGEERVFDLSVTSIGDGDRRLIVLRDITLRTERERELERQNERLDEFASVVSHDLRNPLSVAEGNLELIEETGDLEHTAGVRRGLERIETIVEDLLTMARAGAAIDSTEPVDVDAAAMEAWQHVQNDDEAVEFQTAVETTVAADQSRLLQLFENLFRNAIEHNEEPLTITVERVTEDGTATGFAVTDDGSGIPPADRNVVFEPGHTTSDTGTGLGLSIVKDIVSAHGWSIQIAESETGGARFEVVGCSVRARGADDEQQPSEARSA